jgi:hypothetical protein
VQKRRCGKKRALAPEAGSPRATLANASSSRRSFTGQTSGASWLALPLVLESLVENGQRELAGISGGFACCRGVLADQ